MRPSYEEIETELTQTKEELSQTKKELSRTKEELCRLQELLKKAFEEIANLQEKLNLNSKNSSKPPSTDQKGNTPQKPPKKKKKRKGVSRASFPPERVDKQVECTEQNCPHCGSSSIGLNDLLPEILQQVEIPEVKAIVTEYLLCKYHCRSCGKNSTAQLPSGIPNSSFGPNLMALVANLTGVFHLAKREAVQLIKDLYDIDIGLGSIPNIEERVGRALDPVYQHIHEFVIESKFCKHFDETGWRDSGIKHFVWLASCEHAVFYRIDRSRSSGAFLKLVGMNPEELPSVTDRYAVYNSLLKMHQYCLAHLIRDFKHYSERDGPDEKIGHALANELIKACQTHGSYRIGNISLEARNKRLNYRRKKVEFYLEDGMANGSDKLYRFSEKLLDHFDKLWMFMKIPGMEPTNNLGERDMRKVVIWRKKSYGTRSIRGKKFVERISSVAQSLRRQGKNILSFTQNAIISFYSSEEAPFISPALGF